jgi:tetratricopeptide (TPR) repeat protein
VGNLYGGLSRYLYATYFGLTENNGGGIIDNGPFIPSNEMYALAIEKLQSALNHAADEAETRIVNSLIARCYLFDEQYSQAATFAANGMIEGDPVFETLYSVESANEYYVQAGSGRSQYVADFRFNDYITADPNEANRIQLAEKLGNDETTTYYYQVKYPNQDSPIPIMTWQENNLMLAELVLRGSGTGTPVTLVNAVRASHSIDPIGGSVDLDVIYVERDKELFATASRLPDHKRFNRWDHLPADAWHYLPITQSERNNNPNFN